MSQAANAVGADAVPTGMMLPVDTHIPVTLAVREARDDERPPWEIPYASRFVELSEDGDRVAWFHFCTGHHVEFLYWEATALACDRVVSAIADGDAGEAARWLLRTAALVRGSAAILHYCAAFDSRRYDPCLRPSMAAERDDFSGDMSRDFLAMMRGRDRMAQALRQHRHEPVDALAALRAADDFWQRHHAKVVMSLHPGSSLLRDKLVALRQERATFDASHYIAAVVHSEEALADYDDYFGVVRADAMKIGDYWTQALAKLATVHRSFAMDAHTRAALMHGDGVLLAIVSEMLAAG